MQNKKLFFPFITGLRGYAALMVFLIHTGNLYGINRPFFNRMTEFGKYGVIVFFVISSFTICLSIARKDKFNFKKYLSRRFFRIAPLYFLISIICFAFGGAISGGAYYMHLFGLSPYDPLNLVTHLTFTSLLMQQYQNSLVGVEWTVPLEFAYYLVLPAIFFLTKKNPLTVFVLMILGLFLISHINIYLPIYLRRSGGGEWGLEQYLSIYCIGILLFFVLVGGRVLKNYKISREKVIGSILLLFIGIFYFSSSLSSSETLVLFLSLGLYIYSFVIKPRAIEYINNSIVRKVTANSDTFFLVLLIYGYVKYIVNFQNMFIAIFAGLAIVVSMERKLLSRLIFENKIILHFGKISYSFYLLHLLFVVLAAKFGIFTGIPRVFVILLAVTIVATITQKFIEEPFINGKALDFVYEKFKR